jgi:hypothetical protein
MTPRPGSEETPFSYVSSEPGSLQHVVRSRGAPRSDSRHLPTSAHTGGGGGVFAEEAEAVADLDHEEDVGVAGPEVDDLLLQRVVALAALHSKKGHTVCIAL